MNRLLKLKGQFQQKSSSANFGPPHLQADSKVNSENISTIISNLEDCLKYWDNKDFYGKVFISVTYVTLVPKSRRIDSMIRNYKIVGIKFNNNEDKKHVITYYLEKKEIIKTIDKLWFIKNAIDEKFSGTIDNQGLELIDKKIDFSKTKYSKSDVLKTIVDISNIQKIEVEEYTKKISERTIVSIYDTGNDTRQLLKNMGIMIDVGRIRNTTLLLDPKEIEALQKEAPYLIAMEVVDVSKIPEEKDLSESSSYGRTIKTPSNEPIIGVIDSPFDKKVYFGDWVDDKNLVDGIVNEKDYIHGTSVSSIIVDGPNLNPFLDDECGNFRVRHFGISSGGKFSSFKIMTSIEEIVRDNPDIKVWNISLGSDKEIEENFVSPEGSILDDIQLKYDVIFIVAGTNIPKGMKKDKMKIGAPADSINSLIVNPVGYNNKIAYYARRGEVLSFYVKPDVCYYGGDEKLGINVCCSPNTEKITCGTSYAAPWIARKMAYLIHILGFSREEAKAIIIDSCEKWNEKYSEDEKKQYGHGIVPIKISDIVNTPDDEIKFVISGTSIKYDTYNYRLPVPLKDGKYPFAAKVTMCYFPKCERNQGVDYTSTEFELKLGRLKAKKEDNSYSIASINNDLQDEEGNLTTEEKARREFRKWDNTKCLKERISTRSRDKKAYENPLWGISVTTKNRNDPSDGENIKFGMVITLKEIHGDNRIGDFIQMCSYNRWFVEEVNLENQVELYNLTENEIDFEDN